MGAVLHAQLFVRRVGAHIGLGVATQMQTKAGPVADRQKRHGDLVPLRLRAAEGTTVEIVVQPEMQRVLLPGIRMNLRSAAEGVMNQMSGEPVRHEDAQNAAVIQRITINIGKAFPWNDRFQRRRLLVGGKPLVDGEVGNPAETDFAIAPRLRRGPFDGVVKID